jgi:hypothetical protein
MCSGLERLKFAISKRSKRFAPIFTETERAHEHELAIYDSSRANPVRQGRDAMRRNLKG